MKPAYSDGRDGSFRSDATAQSGEERALVAPSRLHHLFLKAASERWPRASVLGAPGCWRP
ncbi:MULTISPECIES: hypothetical protein [Sorangium]|uniref:hypothetical protein n=1 Tax=Sorangium TaxID=39643 RepID=UPI0012FFA372|nr:hypothetical protein [Sorangium cellulosum]